LSRARHQRLCVIGYGFKDEHINSAIADAVAGRDLELFVISPISADELKGTLAQRQEGVYRPELWSRVVHWPWRVREVFSYAAQIADLQDYMQAILFGDHPPAGR
jgi:hypothetical protein